MNRLQLIEPRFWALEIEFGRFRHETEFSLDVFLLLRAAQSVPANTD